MLRCPTEWLAYCFSADMSSLFVQIRKSFSREHLVFALLKIFRYGFYYLRSRPLAWILKAPQLYIGPHFLLLGTKYLRIGCRFYAHSNLWIEAIPEYKGQTFHPEVIIGNRVSMGDGVHLSCNRRIHVDDDVLFGSNIFVSDHQHGHYKGPVCSTPAEAPAQRPLSLSQNGVAIGQNVWIGNNVVITGNVSIGAGSIIAANSVVTRDVPPLSMVAGIPATLIKRYDEERGLWVSVAG
jgi:acetyltransferase-like isoleucine patch superfamily enzyme